MGAPRVPCLCCLWFVTIVASWEAIESAFWALVKLVVMVPCRGRSREWSPGWCCGRTKYYSANPESVCHSLPLEKQQHDYNYVESLHLVDQVWSLRLGEVAYFSRPRFVSLLRGSIVCYVIHLLIAFLFVDMDKGHREIGFRLSLTILYWSSYLCTSCADFGPACTLRCETRRDGFWEFWLYFRRSFLSRTPRL